MRHAVVLTAVMLAVLTGCATVLDRSTQMVEVTTPGIRGADCFLDTPKNRYRVITPGKVRVERTRHDLTITCSHDGYKVEVIKAESRINAASALNVANGLVPGAAYDAVSGALYEYPGYIEVFMTPEPVDPVADIDEDAADDATARYQKPDFAPLADEADKAFSQNAGKGK